MVGAEVGDRPQVVEVHRVDRAGVGDHDRDPAAERRELPAQRVHVNGFAVAGSRVAQEMERLEFDVGSRRVAGVDVASHRPDMPVTLTGSERLGLGLWNSLPATLAVELTLFALGVAVYQRATAPKDRTGSLAFAGLVAFLLLVYFINLFSPPPPTPTAVAWGAQALWLLVAWGYWIDRHRVPRQSPITSSRTSSR